MTALGVGIVCGVLGYVVGYYRCLWECRVTVKVLLAERDEARAVLRRYHEIRDRVLHGGSVAERGGSR